MWTPFRRHRLAWPSAEAQVAAQQAERALLDARNLDGKVDEATQRAAQIARSNHIASAVRQVFRGAP